MVSDDTVRFVFLCLVTPIALIFLSSILASFVAAFTGFCSVAKDVAPLFTEINRQVVQKRLASKPVIQERIVYKPVHQVVYRDRPQTNKTVNTDKPNKKANKAAFSPVEQDVVSILKSLKISKKDAETVVNSAMNQHKYSDVDSLLNACMTAIKER